MELKKHEEAFNAYKESLALRLEAVADDIRDYKFSDFYTQHEDKIDDCEYLHDLKYIFHEMRDFFHSSFVTVEQPSFEIIEEELIYEYKDEFDDK
jgi:hypothetical protein